MVIAKKFIQPLSRLRDQLRSGGAPVAKSVRPTKPSAQPRAVALDEVLSIPCPDPTAEDRARDAHQNAGLKLARQEDWATLAARLRRADGTLEKTAAGMPVAELVAFGARADVVAAAEHALLDGSPERDAPLMQGIESLEHVLAEASSDPMVAAVVAQAHIDLGWAWRGTGWAIEVPPRNREAFAAHFERAREILEDHDAMALRSPLLSSVKCAAVAGGAHDIDAKVALFEAWIDLDPRNTNAMRALGTQLLPRWNGDYDRLDAEARRIAALTDDLAGAGGYVWVMMDAIATDSEACARVDLDFFLDGLRDILRHTQDQHIANLLAAYCANIMGDAQSGHDEADYVRGRIAEAAQWIVRAHLRELHPVLWASAAHGTDTLTRVRCRDRFAASGYADALRYLSKVFRRELAAGQHVIFTPNGATASGQCIS